MTTTSVEDLGLITYYRTAELPVLEFWWLDDDDTLIDFSTGYTLTFKIGRRGDPALLTKTATGAAGSGNELVGVPNVSVALAAGDLDPIPAATYRWQLRAAAPGALDRVEQGWFELLEVIL